MKTIMMILLVMCVASPEMYVWEQAVAPGKGCYQEECGEGMWPMAIQPIEGFRDQLWMTGQKKVWWSSDGANWQVAEKKDWEERISMAIVFFKDKMWMFGGLKYQSRTFQNDIWSSSDGVNWKIEKEHADWSPRKGHRVVEFDGKLWLLGGADHVDEHVSPDRFVNDVWVSEDGLQWTEVTPAAPWEPTDYPKVIVFKGRLWMFGGQGNSATWSSADGKRWTREAASAPWDKRYDQAVHFYDGQVWVFGGREANPRIAYNDVWTSTDGINWALRSEHAPWTPRTAVFSLVFEDKLWLFAGKHTGSPNTWNKDIWVMRRSP